MKFVFHIPPECLLKTYDSIRNCLNGHEDIIFEAMVQATSAARTPFVLPTNRNEYEQKHEEIVRILSYPAALKGLEIAISLVEEIWTKLRATPGGGTNVELLKLLSFQTNQNAKIRLSENFQWSVEWDISLHNNYVSSNSQVSVDIYKKGWGEICPTYILQYINSALHAYQHRMYAVSLALLSISVEGTLRDALATRGYTFDSNRNNPKRISGLGEALRVSRTVENIVTSRVLPVDFDDVIKAVRNNLIHLSGTALNENLTIYAARSSSGSFTLKDFLSDPEMVFDFVINVPRFISEQYVDLRKAGHFP